MPQSDTIPALKIYLKREYDFYQMLVSDPEKHVEKIHEKRHFKRHERILHMVKFACEPQVPSKVVLDKFANVEAWWGNTAIPNVDTLLSYTCALFDAINAGIEEAQVIQSS
jgi:hypothetical protein